MLRINIHRFIADMEKGVTMYHMSSPVHGNHDVFMAAFEHFKDCTRAVFDRIEIHNASFDECAQFLDAVLNDYKLYFLQLKSGVLKFSQPVLVAHLLRMFAEVAVDKGITYVNTRSSTNQNPSPSAPSSLEHAVTVLVRLSILMSLLNVGRYVATWAYSHDNAALATWVETNATADAPARSQSMVTKARERQAYVEYPWSTWILLMRWIACQFFNFDCPPQYPLLTDGRERFRNKGIKREGYAVAEPIVQNLLYLDTALMATNVVLLFTALIVQRYASVARPTASKPPSTEQATESPFLLKRRTIARQPFERSMAPVHRTDAQWSGAAHRAPFTPQ